MPSILQLALGAASAVAASAHMCAYEPLQRGGVEGSGTAGAGICALTDGPCPSETNAGPASQAYFSGDEIYMNLLKNNDHFNAGAPGNFSAYLWDAAGNSKLLASTRDTNAPSLTLYRLRGSLAGVDAGNYTIQTIYFPNNAQAPPAFFQCSDVSVFKPNTESIAAAKLAHHH